MKQRLTRQEKSHFEKRTRGEAMKMNVTNISEPTDPKKEKLALLKMQHENLMSAAARGMIKAKIYKAICEKPVTMAELRRHPANVKNHTYSTSCREWAESGLIAKDSKGRWHSLIVECPSYQAVVADDTLQIAWRIGDKQVRSGGRNNVSKTAQSKYERFPAIKTVSKLIKKAGTPKAQINADAVKNNKYEGAKAVEQSYLPDQKDFEIASEMFQPLDEQIPFDQILDQIDIIATGAGHRLDHNWREVTEKNIIEKWLHENERGETEPTEDEIKKINKQVGNPRSPEEAQKIINELSAEVINKPIPEKIKIGRSLARNPALAKLVKERQNFKCEICGAEPFLQNNSYPYVEAHHIFELSKSRIDNPHYMICVCPTCHKVLHYGNNEALKNRQKH